MAKVVRSGHGKGARSPLLTGISDDQARKLVGAIKPVKSSVQDARTGTKKPSPVQVRITSTKGKVKKSYIISSKKLKTA